MLRAAVVLSKGRYKVRVATGADDFMRCLALRRQCFGAAGGTPDAYDAAATHILVQEADSGEVVAGFRMTSHSAATLAQSYSAQYYDLTALAGCAGAMLELGRFCVDPAHKDPDILRIAWAALTAHVDQSGVAFLFGCSSFAGTDPAPYADAFALLAARHLAPVGWQPRVRACEVHAYAAQAALRPDLKRAQATMPPLLRSYLLMGGWVSDHAVIDRAMGTMHVFTGLHIASIPPARQKLLRALV